MRAQITEMLLKSLKPESKRYPVKDTTLKGFPVVVHPSGDMVFFLRYRVPGAARTRSPRDYRIGAWGRELTLTEARRMAEGLRGAVAERRDPMAMLQAERMEERATGATVNEVAALFVEKYAKPRNRSWKETDRIFRVYVKPRIGSRALHSIKRADIVGLLDHVEENHGPVMADRVLAAVRKCFTWQMARDDHFVSPIVRGMARSHPSLRERDRTLTDVEIRIMWLALRAQPDAVKRLVRFMLMTGLRRNECARMHDRERLDENRHWLIPAARMKGKLEHLVPMSEDAEAQVTGHKGYLFSTTAGKRPFSGFSKAKAAIDTEMLRLMRKTDEKAKLKPWRLHDLRRTATTLMRRRGISRDITDAVTAHKPPGVGRVYDRWHALPEKAHALEVLADEIRHILANETKIVPLPSPRRSAA